MQLIFRTSYAPRTLVIPIKASRPCEIAITVWNQANRNCVLTKRIDTFEAGESDVIEVQMPLTPKFICLQIVEINNRGYATDPNNCEIGSIRLKGLATHMATIRYNDPDIDEWVLFRGQFAFNANWLPPNEVGQVYHSRTGKFKINYVNFILDDNGKEDITPMRINKYTGIIEVSKNKVKGLTVPGLCAVLDHEYSHMFRNNDPKNEVEADLNGVAISLCCGFPGYECKEVYYTVMYATEGDESLQRLHVIDDFVDRFHNLVNS